MTPKPYTHRDAVPYRPLDWTGVHPPAFPKGGVPRHVAVSYTHLTLPTSDLV